MYLSQDAEDAALIARCRAGDLQGFELLVRRYERLLFNVALRMVGNRDDAADATQNAFVKTYQHLDDFDGRRRFFSSIYRILVNECLNVCRARRPEGEPPEHSSRAAGPFEALEQGERRLRIQAALLALPHDLREVVVLRHFGSLSYDEMAAAIGVPARTVKSRLYSARQRLGELLLDWEPGHERPHR